MDLQKVGKFLSELRKEKGLTQEQLGVQLGVTNKTVSRWENGNYLPPVELLQMLSELYGLTINEIISAQRLDFDEYQAKAEENIKSVLSSGNYSFSARERHIFFRNKWNKENIGMILMELTVGIVLMIACAMFRENIGFMLSCAVFLFRVRAYTSEYTAYMEDKQALYTGEAMDTMISTKSNYAKRWFREQIWFNILYIFPPLAFMIAGAVRSDTGFIILGTVLGFLVIIVRSSDMRGYAERMQQKEE